MMYLRYVGRVHIRFLPTFAQFNTIKMVKKKLVKIIERNLQFIFLILASTVLILQKIRKLYSILYWKFNGKKLTQMSGVKLTKYISTR